MATALTAADSLRQRWGKPWLIGLDAATFWSHLADFQTQLQAAQPQDVVLAEPDPVRFLAAFLAACQHPCRVWLTNPQWGTQEWSQVSQQCHPDYIFGPVPPMAGAEASEPPITTQILIPTGGSSGNMRFAVHTWETLTASVQGFQQHFECAEVSAYCVLPLYHVSGLMQALRCLLSGGQLVWQPFSGLLETGAIAAPLTNPFLSLVPTQLQRLLGHDRDWVPWLRSFTAILLGGGPAWPSLLAQARRLQIPLAPTFGMTETASQIATLLPQEFWAGHTSSGRALPHVTLTIRNAEGCVLPPYQLGQITIEATSLAQGYWQQPFHQPFQSGDIGYLDAGGFLQVRGREQTLINTGGEKVLPEEVEAAIRQTGFVKDVAVLGIPDAEWGEKVVAIAVADGETALSDRLRVALKPLLSPYKIPKQWVFHPALPRSAQGKLNRTELRRWVMAELSSPAATTESALPSGDDADG